MGPPRVPRKRSPIGRARDQLCTCSKLPGRTGSTLWPRPHVCGSFGSRRRRSPYSMAVYVSPGPGTPCQPPKCCGTNQTSMRAKGRSWRPMFLRVPRAGQATVRKPRQWGTRCRQRGKQTSKVQTLTRRASGHVAFGNDNPSLRTTVSSRKGDSNRADPMSEACEELWGCLAHTSGGSKSKGNYTLTTMLQPGGATLPQGMLGDIWGHVWSSGLGELLALSG